MLKKIKKLKIARELIAVILVTLLFKFQPNAVNLNFTIFVSLIFISTIPGSSEENSFIKTFSIPTITFYAITLLLMFNLIQVLTINYIISIGALTNVKAVKKIMKNRLAKLNNSKAEQKKSEEENLME